MPKRRTRQVKSNREVFRREREQHVVRQRKPVVAKNPGQKDYIRAIINNEIVICEGMAGTGKTHIAIGMAIHALDRGHVDKIVITRPAVESGEKLGFLPGDLNQKLDPYMRPVFDELGYYSNNSEIYQLRREGKIEVCPLAYMRGRTLSNAFIIADELQNASYGQIKNLVTRIGMNSKMVLTGDITQSDLDDMDCGAFHDICNLLVGIDGIEIIRLGISDMVRNPIIGEILKKLEGRD